jgi:HPr kinase/phosphorylase
MARDVNVPVYRTSVPSTDFMATLRDFLNDQFALQQTVHGSLVDVYGVGLLLTGSRGSARARSRSTSWNADIASLLTTS